MRVDPKSVITEGVERTSVWATFIGGVLIRRSQLNVFIEWLDVVLQLPWLVNRNLDPVVP